VLYMDFLNDPEEPMPIIDFAKLLLVFILNNYVNEAFTPSL